MPSSQSVQKEILKTTANKIEKIELWQNIFDCKPTVYKYAKN